MREKSKAFLPFFDRLVFFVYNLYNVHVRIYLQEHNRKVTEEGKPV